MEDRLKKRLVGAAVLIALLVAFGPMVLEQEPLLAPPMPPGKVVPERPQLHMPDNLQPLSADQLGGAPPPAPNLPFMEQNVPITPPGGTGVTPPSGGMANNPPSAGQPPPVAAIAAPPTHPMPAPGMAGQPPATPPSQVAVPVAPPTLPPGTKGWAVQLGSFSEEAKAKALAADLIARGSPGFISPVESGGRKLFRVMVGPQVERAGSEKDLSNLAGWIGERRLEGAAVRSYP